jgi:S1-C subfamily serine protease
MTATATAGRPLTITIQRDGDRRDVQLRPTDPPEGLGLRILEEIAGLRVADESRRVIIDDVLRGSRSAQIGLAQGDLIVGVNGAEVRSTRELNHELIKSAERSSIVLSVARGRYIYNLTFPMGV